MGKENLRGVDQPGSEPPDQLKSGHPGEVMIHHQNVYAGVCEDVEDVVHRASWQDLGRMRVHFGEYRRDEFSERLRKVLLCGDDDDGLHCGSRSGSHTTQRWIHEDRGGGGLLEV